MGNETYEQRCALRRGARQQRTDPVYRFGTGDDRNEDAAQGHDERLRQTIHDDAPNATAGGTGDSAAPSPIDTDPTD